MPRGGGRGPLKASAEVAADPKEGTRSTGQIQEEEVTYIPQFQIRFGRIFLLLKWSKFKFKVKLWKIQVQILKKDLDQSKMMKNCQLIRSNGLAKDAGLTV